MWAFATVVLLIVLVITVAVNQRREQETLDRLTTALETAGDDRTPPRSVDAALDRFENLLHSDDSELDSQRAEAAFERLTTGAVITDADGQVILRNRLAEPYAQGRHGDALVELEIQARLRDALLGESTEQEVRLHGPPIKELVVMGSPIIDEGELLGAVILIDDVSEQRRLDTVRRDFVANVSHELRTPVGALSLLAETLQGEDDPDVIKSFLGRIQDESERLSRLVDDLLDLSKIEGGVEEHAEVLDLRALAEESAASVRPSADHKNVTLSLELNDVPPIYGDRSQLISAMTNLLSNAVKYTDAEGEVGLRLVAHGDEAAIVVSDTGIGIPQKDVNRVFERFYRVDRGRNAKTGGTGLGLSIVRHVAVNHGGRVELVSQEGVGSTFSMILPIGATALDAADAVDNRVGERDE